MSGEAASKADRAFTVGGTHHGVVSIGLKITPFIGFEKYPPLVFKESLFFVRPNVGTKVPTSAFP